MTDATLVLYKVDNAYDATRDGGVRWDDADIGVDWGVAAEGLTLSDKDRRAPLFRDWVSPFEYGVTT